MLSRSLKVLVLGLLLLFLPSTVYAANPYIKGKIGLCKQDHKENGKGNSKGEIDKDDRDIDEDDNEIDEDNRNVNEGNWKNDKSKGKGKGHPKKNIKEKKPKYIPVTSVTFNKTSITLKVGSWERLAATVNPKEATDKQLFWCSSDPMVATVNPSGKVTGISSGKAEIYVIARDGFKIATCAVTVTDGNVSIPVTGISLNKTSLAISVGARETLAATLQPSDATDKTVFWFSSNPDVAVVDRGGTVTGRKTGSTVIYAVTREGFKVASCQVTVNSSIIDVHVTGVSLDHTSLDITLGSTDYLTAAVSPNNASEKSLIWRSSNPDIVKVDQAGRIWALKEGTAVVTVETVDGGKSAGCTVYVKTPIIQVPVTSVAIIKTTPDIALKVGSVKYLTAEVKPDNATNKSITWSSSNSGVATVNQSGCVSGVAEGTATITVTTADGAKSDSCSVRVIPADKWQAVTSIHLNLSNTTLPVGFVEELRYQLEPAAASELEVRWSSSNSAVASVNSSGKVTAKVSGTAIITATTVDSSKTAACFVTVIPALETPAAGILLNKIACTIEVGETDYPKVLVYPPGTAVPTVTWTTSKPAVATVTQNGQVTGISPGISIITAKTADNKTASYIITVVPLNS